MPQRFVRLTIMPLKGLSVNGFMTARSATGSTTGSCRKAGRGERALAIISAYVGEHKSEHVKMHML